MLCIGDTGGVLKEHPPVEMMRVISFAGLHTSGWHCGGKLLLDSQKLPVFFADQMGRKKRETMAVAHSFESICAAIISYAFGFSVCVVTKRIEIVVGVDPKAEAQTEVVLLRELDL